MDTNNLRREEVPGWVDPVNKLNLWDAIDAAVCRETERIRVAAQFLKMYGPIGYQPRVLAEKVDLTKTPELSIAERDELDIVEISVSFSLAQRQVQEEKKLQTAVTLATRAANLLAMAEDTLIFQGDAGLAPAPAAPAARGRRAVRIAPLVPANNLQKVVKDGSAGNGLLNAPGNPIPPDQAYQVPLAAAGNTFAEETFTAVSKAVTQLTAKGNAGPYAVIFPTAVFADSHKPLANTMVTPASAISALVVEDGKKRFYGTATLPAERGLVISLGGITVDRVVGVDATTEFTQVDGKSGRFLFRLFERFTVRPKDSTAFFILDFSNGAGVLW